jgi:hypothetical protein
MVLSRGIAVSGLILAGCVSMPDGALPAGTYRETDAGADGAVDAIVVDGDELTVYLPSVRSGRAASLEGRAFAYDALPDGSLRLWGSSNDAFYLDLIRSCDWRWSGVGIECRRDAGDTWSFVRDDSRTALPPALPQQQVWLAAARHVQANESSGAGADRVLTILHRTSFPRPRSSLAQLERQAEKEFCGLSREDASGVVRSLHWQNKRAASIGDVFDHRPEFRVVERRPKSGDSLGMSDVVFSRDGNTAYLNVDIGGQSGSVVQMRRDGHAWAWAAECAVWTSY